MKKLALPKVSKRRNLILVAVAAVVVNPFMVSLTHAEADSTVGGQITRSETLTRARDWFNRKPQLTYDNSRAAGTLVSDIDGAHKYGTDCSGYVSMAWHLKPGSYGGLNTGSLPSVSTAIDRGDLKPGDLLDDVPDGHAVLFEAWESDHVHFSYYSFGSTPIKHITHFSFSDSTLSGHPTANYKAYRYKNIIEDAAPPPHGTVWDRARDVSGVWAVNATNIDKNPSIVAASAAGLRDGSMHVQTVVPGSGTWDRTLSASGVWDGSATQVDANGAATAVAAAGLPDGRLQLVVLIPGSGVWARSRSASGVWDANATHIDTNGSITDIAIAALPNGTLQFVGLVPGSGVWGRSRSASGVWDVNATHIDSNPSGKAVSVVALPDGTVHVDVVIPGSGIWDRGRSAGGVWDANAVHSDTNGNITAVSAAALPDGTMHVDGVVPGSGIWDRVRSASGVWAANATHVDTNGTAFAGYTAALPNGVMHLGVIPNAA